MGVTVKNQKDLDKMVNSVRGGNIPGYSGGRLD